MLPRPVVQRRALHPLHDEIGVGGTRQGVPDAMVEQARNARVVITMEELRLALEALILGIQGHFTRPGELPGAEPERSAG